MNARRVVTITWIVGLVLAIAAPALAKGVDSVTFIGGGQEVTFAGSGEPNSDNTLSKLVGGARFFGGLWGDQSMATPPSGELGPRVTAEWHFPLPESTVIVQYLYPFAEEGPVGHIPGGQEYVGEFSAESWFPLAPDIADRLAAIGFDVTVLDFGAAPVSPTALPTAVAPTATWGREATPPPPPDLKAGGSSTLVLIVLGLVAGAAPAIWGIMQKSMRRMA